ncbi:MAG: hypothetical protein FWH10_06715, partial [Oscillospiraceae bacterium]|nr:hypothetical protein [Oscillospiraceae bacterium]
MFIIKNKKIIILFLMCLLVFVPAPSGSSGMNPVSADSVIDDLQKQINDRQASIKASAARRKELEKSIANLKNQQAVAINDKRVYDNLIAEIEAEARETEALIEDLKELIARGETDIMNAQEEYDRSYGLFLEMIRFAHEEGDTDYLGMLLKSKSFTDFLARMDIISSMLEYNKNVIDSLVQSKETLEKAKQTHENMAEQNSEFVGHLAKISAEVKELSDKAEKAINQANRDLQENIALQAELDRDALSTQSEIARLSKELQARQESQRKYVGGTFLWPLPTANGRVSSGFGSRRSPITGRPEHHDGIDIPAPKNTDIYAVND